MCERIEFNTVHDTHTSPCGRQHKRFVGSSKSEKSRRENTEMHFVCFMQPELDTMRLWCESVWPLFGYLDTNT